MNLIISNSSGKPIYEQITDQIKTSILSGELQEGQALPSMRALARDLRISVITTKRAYEELEREGFLTTVPGKGCFAVHTYRAQDDARRLSLEQQLRELLQELRAMGVSEEDIQALCREGEAK